MKYRARRAMWIPAAAIAFAWSARASAEDRAEKVVACTRALQDAHTNANVIALVHALVDGPRPTSTELFQAIAIVDAERARSPRDAPTPVIASCVIAERMGDGVMLRSCRDEIDRVAPESDEAHRVHAILDAEHPSWRFWGGWALVAGAAAATIAHASRRRARVTAVAGAVLIGAMVTSSVAHAEDKPPPHGWLSQWPIDEAHPETSIPSEKDRNADPMEFGYRLQDLALKGERASASGDHAASARFYAALGKAVPDRAVGFAKACEEWEKAGDRDLAIESCGAALLRDGLTVRDYQRFVDVVTAKSGSLSAKETAALRQVVAHVRQDPVGKDLADDLECKVGVRISDVGMLKECTAGLAAATAPTDARATTYTWALGVLEQRDRSHRLWTGLAIALFLGAVGVLATALLRRTKANEAHP